MLIRRVFGSALGALLLTLLAASAVLGHHGWRWTADGNVELTGIIKTVRLGNPHGRVTLQVEQEQWLVEVGQPWRNESAGVTDEMLSPGAEITAVGHRSADPDERRLKAERLRIGGQEYVLYPDRD